MSVLDGKLALARSATDRAALHRTDAAWLDAAWTDDKTRVLVVGDGQTLVHGDAIAFLAPSVAPEGERFFLGVDDAGAAYFAVATQGPPQALPGSAAVAAGLRAIGSVLGDRDAGLLVLAVGLANWHATHTHCPRCGTATVVEQAGFVRRCPNDGSEHYPRTDPAIIVLVTDTTGERALLGSSGQWGKGRFSTLAGFVEPGESAEAALIREVGEESGVAVEAVTYLGSQPWPFPSSLMLGYLARAKDPGAVPEGDGTEIVEARWFTRAEVAEGLADGSLTLPPAVSIARRLIEHWYGAELPDPAEPRW